MPEALFSNVFRSPFVDVLRLFAAEDWAHAELRGDVQQAIDKEIGKRTFVMRGKTAAANFLALPCTEACFALSSVLQQLRELS